MEPRGALALPAGQQSACLACGEAFVPVRKGGKQRFCSRACRDRDARERKRADRKTLETVCGAAFRREMALYAKTGRAIHAWCAYRWIREAGLPVPPWFREYLDQCAERLIEMAPKSPEDVAAAFSLDRIGRKRIGSDQLAAVETVVALKSEYKLPNAGLEELFAEVATQIGKSESYVRDAWYRWFPKN